MFASPPPSSIHQISDQMIRCSRRIMFIRPPSLCCSTRSHQKRSSIFPTGAATVLLLRRRFVTGKDGDGGADRDSKRKATTTTNTITNSSNNNANANNKIVPGTNSSTRNFSESMCQAAKVAERQLRIASKAKGIIMNENSRLGLPSKEQKQYLVKTRALDAAKALMNVSSRTGEILEEIKRRDCSAEVKNIHGAFLVVTSWLLDTMSSSASTNSLRALKMAVLLARRSFILGLPLHRPLYQRLMEYLAEHSESNRLGRDVIEISSWTSVSHSDVPMDAAFFRKTLLSLIRRGKFKDTLIVLRSIKRRHQVLYFDDDTQTALWDAMNTVGRFTVPDPTTEDHVSKIFRHLEESVDLGYYSYLSKIETDDTSYYDDGISDSDSDDDDSEAAGEAVAAAVRAQLAARSRALRGARHTFCGVSTDIPFNLPGLRLLGQMWDGIDTIRIYAVNDAVVEGAESTWGRHVGAQFERVHPSERYPFSDVTPQLFRLHDANNILMTKYSFEDEGLSRHQQDSDDKVKMKELLQTMEDLLYGFQYHSDDDDSDDDSDEDDSDDEDGF